jgi:hypothetical protein
MKLQVSITFDTVTEKSAREGMAADHGFVVEQELWTVKDTISRLSRCTETSSSVIGGWTWAEDEATQDYRTGEYYSEAVHVRRADGTPLTDRQAQRLFKAAGLIKAA